MAMIRAAPTSDAAWIAFKPMPPQPSTATVSPGRTPAVLSTAPTPVVTPQPMSAALSRGMSGRILTSRCSWTSSSSEKLARS